MHAIGSAISRNIGVPLKAIIKREPARKVLEELNRTQWLTRGQLESLRRQRLKQLLVEVGKDVPFYREQLQKLGADPEADDPWEILRGLPTIDKEMYRSLGSDLRSESPRRKPRVVYTSGTTGDYLVLYRDPLARTYGSHAGMRGRQWWGVQPGDPEFKIWGGGSRSAWAEGHYRLAAVRKMKEWFLALTVVPPFFESDKELKWATDLLFRRRPRFVMGYSNTLHLFASYMVKTGRRAGPGWPAAVAYSAEMLHESQRDVIEEAFNAPLVAEYGSVEAGVIAYTCKKRKLHVSDDILAVEILDGDRALPNGQVGEVVVTGLIGGEYPLIRYRQQDLACLDDQPCDCGLGLSVMSSLQGRLNDQFLSPSGGVIDFVAFALAIKKQPAIRRFKVVERGQGDLVFICEVHEGQEWQKADRERLLQQCLNLLPADVKVSIGYVGRLHPDKSGKFRIMIPNSEADKYLRDYAWADGNGH
jgi:phenylacetate-CoA ligase